MQYFSDFSSKNVGLQDQRRIANLESELSAANFKVVQLVYNYYVFYTFYFLVLLSNFVWWSRAYYIAIHCHVLSALECVIFGRKIEDVGF